MLKSLYTILFFTLYLVGVSDVLPNAYHKHDKQFIESSLKVLPVRFKKTVNYNYSNTFNRYGRYAANINLLNLKTDLKHYNLAHDDAEIISQAERAAKHCLGEYLYKNKLAVCHTLGVTAPDTGTEAGNNARLNCDLWWRRQLRKVHGQRVEKVAINLGMVHKKRECYASTESVDRRQQQKKRNNNLLETLAATNQDGQTYTLKELSDLTTSNPELRRNELMTRIRGFEEMATSEKKCGMFYTLTCPSRMHKKTTSRKGGVYDNQNYDETTPRQAQAYLSSVWSRFRAAIHRRGINVYGFRVAEPQHDGTPHWHLLLFMKPEDSFLITTLFKKYALQENPEEKGASLHRFDIKAIDPEKGTAAGYIAKYISKNVDGFAIDADLFGNDPIKAAARVQAWAATWGIRQFQQIGGASVTVWRELRRMDSEESGALEEARQAADVGDWAAFNKAMLATDIKPLYLQEVNKDTGEIKTGRYGDVSQGQIIGVENNGVFYVTRFHNWTIEKVEKNDFSNSGLYSRGIGSDGLGVRGINKAHMAQQVGGLCDTGFSENSICVGSMASDIGGGGFELSADFSRPWTCVNNCTVEKLERG